MIQGFWQRVVWRKACPRNEGVAGAQGAVSAIKDAQSARSLRPETAFAKPMLDISA